MLYAHTCAHIAPAEFIRMRISIIVSTFNIPLWNLRREQQISRHVSAWYTPYSGPYSNAIFPISQTAGRAPGPGPGSAARRPGSPRISPIPLPAAASRAGRSSSADSLITHGELRVHGRLKLLGSSGTFSRSRSHSRSFALRHVHYHLPSRQDAQPPAPWRHSAWRAQTTETHVPQCSDMKHMSE